MREWAELKKISCNLIGSESGRNFLIRPAHCVSLGDELKFPIFFLHRLRLHTEVIFH